MNITASPAAAIRALLNAQYLPSLTTLNTEGLWKMKDIAYVADGHPKHTLDILMADNPFPRPLQPVLVFFHGEQADMFAGAWQRGDKQSNLNLYWNVGVAAARAGAVGVICNYRLSPEVTHPAHLQDVNSAMQWVFRNIKRYGGDPTKVVISGHSAGAHLAALWAVQPLGISPLIRGMLGISGVFNILRLGSSNVGQALVEPAFGADILAWKAATPAYVCSAASMIHHCKSLLINAEEDFHLTEDAAELDAAFASHIPEALSVRMLTGSSQADWGGSLLRELPDSKFEQHYHPMMRRIVIPQSNHMTIIGGIGHAGDRTTQIITKFLQGI